MFRKMLYLTSDLISLTFTSLTMVSMKSNSPSSIVNILSIPSPMSLKCVKVETFSPPYFNSFLTQKIRSQEEGYGKQQQMQIFQLSSSGETPGWFWSLLLSEKHFYLKRKNFIKSYILFWKIFTYSWNACDCNHKDSACPY